MNEPQQGVIPHLVVEGASAAIDFYAKAFGARELMRVPEEGGERLMHAAITLNGATIYLMDDFPEHCPGDPTRGESGKGYSPRALGGSPVVLHLDVPDCDAAFAHAVAAGATARMEPWDAFWGDRYAQVVDPFGHAWSLAHRLPAGDPA